VKGEAEHAPSPLSRAPDTVSTTRTLKAVWSAATTT
jgi:hypothetical protein